MIRRIGFAAVGTPAVAADADDDASLLLLL